MPRRMYKVLLDAPLEAVWAFHEDIEHGLSALTPPQVGLQITRADEPKLGAQVVVRVRTPIVVGGRRKWHAKYVEYQPPTGQSPDRRAWFVDEQVTGPFKRWRHEHRFEEVLDEGRTKVWLNETVEYGVGLGPVGVVADRVFVRRAIDRVFAYRNRVLRERLCRR